MRLLRVELSRLAARRAVVLLVLAAGLLTALITITTVVDTRPVTAEERAAAQAQVAELQQSQEFQENLADCRANPEQFLGERSSADQCESIGLTEEDFLFRAPLSLEEEAGDGGVAIVVIITALLIIAGTTYAGADWSTGSMSNQVIFEPRRLRVWAFKALAVTLVGAVLSAALLAAYWGTLLLVAQARGIETSNAVLGQVGWLTGRGVLLASTAALGGYALTMLLRSTVATLALLFAYTVGGEALLAVAPIERAGQWSLANNTFAWIRDGIGVYDPTIVCPPTSQTCSQEFTLTMVEGGLYLLVLLLLVMLLSALLFRRRDVP